MSDKPGYISGLVTGLIFGGVAALLMAPKKGQEFRDELKGNAEKLKDHASNVSTSVGVAAIDVKEHATDLLNSAKEKGAALKDEALHHVEDVKATVNSTASDVKNEVATVANEAKATVTQAKEDAQAEVEEVKDDAKEVADKAKDAVEQV